MAAGGSRSVPWFGTGSSIQHVARESESRDQMMSTFFFFFLSLLAFRSFQTYLLTVPLRVECRSLDRDVPTTPRVVQAQL